MSDDWQGCSCGGEHRTTGSRAWCLKCQEWCHPYATCEIKNATCEIADLREQLRISIEALEKIETYWSILRTEHTTKDIAAAALSKLRGAPNTEPAAEETT